MNSLAGKTAIVTGVSRRQGIGFAIAKQLAGMGANLFVQSYAPYDVELDLPGAGADADELIRKIRSENNSIKHMQADFREAAAPGQVMSAAVNAFGHIDILVLNHTYDTLKQLEDLTPEEIDNHLAVNVRANLLFAQNFAEQYKGGPGGRIVWLISGQHLGPMPDLAYVASKGALHNLTWSLSQHLIGRGITVNAVNPGPTKTWKVDAEVDNAVLERMPQGRWGMPEDAARLIGWLVSEEAQWVTGQIINSEGGFRH